MVANSTALPSYNECRYALYDAETKCHSDRNCADCLKKPGCRIGISGYCEPDTSLDDPEGDALNYQHAIVTNVSQPISDDGGAASMAQQWHFPSSQVTYCGGDDAACNACAENNYGISIEFDADSRFCLGSGGCVCVQNCKSSFLEEASCDLQDTAASRPAISGGGDCGGAIDNGTVKRVPSGEAVTGSKTSSSASAGVWTAFTVAVVVVAVVLGFAYKRLRGRRANQFEGVPQEVDDESTKNSHDTNRV